MTSSPELATATSYGSARDLPSFRDMELFVKGAKILTLFLARDQREKILEVEREMTRLVDVVDRFYERLGSRNWIFPDVLNIEDIGILLEETDDANEAEQRLISLYADKDASRFWIQRLCMAEGLRQRRHQIERALRHYQAEEFDSCVLHLIAVMDGFVNDFQPGLRKGLTSREPDEMLAWDSVVGHHLGLTHALKAFRKTIKRRVDEEVFELYRNGIVHGSVIRFDNPIVATKAWNMLSAVADWATAATRAAKPSPPQPSWRDLMTSMRENERVKRALDAWARSSYAAGDEGFENLNIYKLANQFLEAWRRRNFGTLAELESRAWSKGKTQSQLAGEIRDRFEGFELGKYAIQQIENSAPAVWLVRGTARINDSEGTFECRWMGEDEDGKSAFEPGKVLWHLHCTPTVWRPDS